MICRWLFAVLLITTMIVPTAAKPKGPRARDIADSIDANRILTKFATLVRAADLGTFLSSRGPFTVFAPTDSAFARLDPGVLDLLMQPQNKARLQAIVLFHVVNGKQLTSLELKTLKSENSCQGSPLLFKLSRLGTQYVMKARITNSNIKCVNGVINQIDTLLMPPETSLPPVLATAPAPEAPATPPNAVTPVTGDTNNPPVVPVAPSATPDASPN